MARGNWPTCPDCKRNLIFVTTTKINRWGCNCGYEKDCEEPSFIKAVRDYLDKDQDPIRDAQQEKEQ